MGGAPLCDISDMDDNGEMGDFERAFVYTLANRFSCHPDIVRPLLQGG